MGDICVDIGSTRVNVRVGCILKSEGKVLLTQTIGENWWFLPGGRVRAGESFHDAIVRELEEEIGCDVSVGRCIVVSENFFENHGVRFHEIGAYFAAELRDSRDLVAQQHENEMREWIVVNQAERMEIFPEFLRRIIASPPSTVEHIVCRDS